LAVSWVSRTSCAVSAFEALSFCRVLATSSRSRLKRLWVDQVCSASSTASTMMATFCGLFSRPPTRCPSGTRGSAGEVK
jgi:hypothetical protein